MWVTYSSMACLQVADGGDSVQMQRVGQTYIISCHRQARGGGFEEGIMKTETLNIRSLLFRMFIQSGSNVIT